MFNVNSDNFQDSDYFTINITIYPPFNLPQRALHESLIIHHIRLITPHSHPGKPYAKA